MFSFSKDIGIDLGTANTLVCIKGKGIILREPSVVAVDMRSDNVLAVGSQAKDMIGRTPGSIVAVRPLKDGVIADFKITAKMLQHFIKKAVKPGIFSKPRVIICMPTGVSWLEKVRFQNVRVYFSGDNLLTFTDMFQGLDPERTAKNSRGVIYPQAKVVSFGLKVTL